MIYLIVCLIFSLSLLITCGFLFIKTSKLDYFKISSNRHLNILKVSDKANRYLKRANISLEKFLIICSVIILGVVFQLIKAFFIGSHLEIQDFALSYVMMMILYLNIVSKNNKFKNEVKEELEKIMRTSHFLEKTGTQTREIQRYLSGKSSVHLGKYFDTLASSCKIIVDQVEVYKRMKADIPDISELVSFANICLQKIDTGKSERILKNQLRSIKKLKHEQFKIKRRKNRLKFILMSFVLSLSFSSVVVYPMIKDLLNNLSNLY